MFKLLVAGLAGLILAGPALAQDGDRDGRRGWEDNRGGGWRGDDRGRRGDDRGWRGDNRGDWRGNDGWRGNGRGGWDNRRGNDWRWNQQRYRGPAFIHPRGYGYRPWGVGYRLPRAYFGNRYFIGNPGFYRLPPAWYGTRWVRVGPDALLIRLGDGIVLRAVRGLYW
ncbi:RcnB family protein [Sandarakinorhabdus sp. DWP1-3-1]|uniref:RcnB family protein n=1 Tax=Sandarakinorhabdus sp. DWP1-3-1 TaxID=2804627 RepID=UPI003CEBC361